MSTSRMSQSSGESTAKTKREVRVAQATADAKLNTAFEASAAVGGSFDYTKSVGASLNAGSEAIPSSAVTAYLQRMQRGGITQTFGCMLMVEEGSFRVRAFSENAGEMLDLVPQAVPSMGQQSLIAVGTDIRTLFTSASVSLLEKAAMATDVSVMNPVSLQSRAAKKPFFAVLHRIDVGLVVDLEPVRPSDPNVSAAGAMQSHKLAAKAISRLQSLPGGDIGLLCDAVVEEVRELTGYDRVMAYKFHEDEHGEVIAEIRRSDLEPYLGLHYPATDIPQAARFLFMKNRVRIICDCSAPPVKVIQDPTMKHPISLAGSTLRGVHGCHAQYMANMGSVASLVMAVIINDNSSEEGATAAGGILHKGRKLWGLVVCHHSSPRYVPFPLRSACEFLMQVFGLQLNMEVELSSQLREKHILRTQTLLCDMLLRDAPMGIVSQSPNITDLVKCDGAALFYHGRAWLLGVTPSEAQVRDIAAWLLDSHKDSTGLSTDSLADAGYPNADSLGVSVCGMAAARITSKDFLFWFRSHAQKEVKWAGAKQEPGDRDREEGEEGGRMHPRSSFQAFLEVVKQRSLPWEDVEMDAIHSLQLILRGSFQDMEGEGGGSQQGNKRMINARLNDLKLQGMDELSTVANEMVRLIETATAPILAVDSLGCVNGWNAKVSELTGLPVSEAMGKSLVKDLVQRESREAVERVLYMALNGEEEQNVEIQLKTWGPQLHSHGGTVILVVNACASRDVSESVVGVCFVGQDVTGEKEVLDKFIRIQGDYTTIVRSRNSLIPPIFGSDEYGCCTEWNPAMEKLTGVRREDVIGRMLMGDVFGSALRLRGSDGLTQFMIVLNRAMDGADTDKFPFTFYDREGKCVDSLLTANKRTDADGAITGVFCFLHTVSLELQQALSVQKAAERVAEAKAKELAYIRQEIQNPLDGIHFARSFIEHTELSEDQKQLMETSATCEKQLRRILDDMDLESIEEGYLELETGEFMMATVMNSVVSQGMVQSSKKGLQLFCDTPPEFKSMCVFGDQVRLQQVLADFLMNAVQFTPASGWVEIKVVPNVRSLPGGITMAHMEFRVTHSGEGLPEDLVHQMFDRADAHSKSQEGLGLSMCRKIVRLMSGEVRYVREPGKSYFLVLLDLPLAQREDAGSAM
uniref:Phytochrome n=1 Tax=Mesotaenium caldariorum TaxID=31321 RepID=Q40263_9VIRI|nr:phytochrome [Mesotaenium caldariorum]prf//2207374B phytochrome photoreceptor [Mesotaenium caldariorum]